MSHVATLSIIQSSSYTKVAVNCAYISVSVNAVLDPGSAGNFISAASSTSNQSSEPPYSPIHSVTGKPLEKRIITFCAKTTLNVSCTHVEEIYFLVPESLILEHPWLQQHRGGFVMGRVSISIIVVFTYQVIHSYVPQTTLTSSKSMPFPQTVLTVSPK